MDQHSHKNQASQPDISTFGEGNSNEYQKPLIWLCDFDEHVEQELQQLKFNYTTGSLGKSIRVNNINRNDEKLLLLNHYFPGNLHEYDIILIDMTVSSIEQFNINQNILQNAHGKTASVFRTCFPQSIFHPQPLVSSCLLAEEIKDISNKKSIIVAFIGDKFIADYEIGEINQYGFHITESLQCSSINFYYSLPNHTSRKGKKSIILNSKLTALFEKYSQNIEYGTIFFHPRSRDSNNTSQHDPNFVPLLLNEKEEIISYAHEYNQSMIFVFPNISKKSLFIRELLQTYLPEIIPDLFPYHGQFKWLDNGEYLLPGEQDLISQKQSIKEKYQQDIQKNEKQIKDLKDKYSFLHDLLSKSGGELVKAVEFYLRWLGFKDVINLDETKPELLEEDIQVNYEEKLLIIEVKGLGGTSQDSQCSQIGKICHRRSKERGKFDVFGLYLVNHQRYMPPKSRKNPPFSENQIKDAELDTRGLLTTYELYKAYFLIEDGLLTKEEVRGKLFETGLIQLEPNNILFIGKNHPAYYQNGTVTVLNLDNNKLKIGDSLLAKKDDQYKKITIISLQVNNEDVREVESGEVGIGFNEALQRNSELYIFQESHVKQS